MRGVRILQAGDVHLGTAFSGSGMSQAQARKRRRELLGTFRRLCEAAVEHRADVLLLVGDLFEAEWVSDAEAAEVRQLLSRLPIPVFLTPGNHDALLPGGPYSWGEWPEHVHVFGGEPAAVELPELPLTVHGYGYAKKWLRENPLAGYRVPEDGRLHVVMVHGSYEAPEGTPYWPISRAEVEALGADYVAFGHYHQPQVLLEAGGLVQAAYAGSLEPLGLDEPGEHGAFLLDLEKGGARLTWLPLAEREYRRVCVAVDGCTSVLDVAQRVQAAIGEERRGRDLVEVALTGGLDPQFWLDLADLQERVSPWAFHLRLVDRTVPDLDADSYAPRSAAGRFVAKMKERIAAEENEGRRRLLEQALAYGLLAYERGKVVKG
jgi:exonuclease SbcD